MLLKINLEKNKGEGESMEQTLYGKGVSKGIGIGKAKIIETQEVGVSEFKIEDTENEWHFLQDCYQKVIQETETLVNGATGTQNEIMEAYVMLLKDPSLLAEAKKMIEQEKYNAGYAVKKSFSNLAQHFEEMKDPYFATRASDILDMGNRIIAQMVQQEEIDLEHLEDHTILIGKEMTASQIAKVNLQQIAGIILQEGNENSHVSIMARTNEIPTIVGARDCMKIQDQEFLAMDGECGEITIHPSEETITQLRKRQEKWLDKKESLKQYLHKVSQTIDGRKVEIYANIGHPQDMKKALENGAEGVGLFRSEFLYMESDHMPTEEEQFQAYQEVLKSANGKKVIIRTLDIGGDKDLKYWQLEPEENPFLGYRAIRICLAEPSIFKTQLRALYRASQFGQLAIMFPMISSLDEIREVKKIVKETQIELEKSGENFDSHVPLGVMIEIPSSALMAKELAKECDFFSIGTNDLIQYTLAVERGNAKIEKLYTKYHPAVIRFIQMAIEGAHQANIPCGMCGEAAAEKIFIPLLMGLGLDEFSMNPSRILNTRRLICKLEEKSCQELANQVLQLKTAKEIKDCLIAYKQDHHL